MEISALEINPKFVRAIKLGRSGNNLVLKKIAEAPLGDGSIQDGRIINPDAFMQTLGNFLRRNRFPGSHWIVSLPLGAIFTTYKNFPNLSLDDLEEAVQINVPTLLPGKAEEISWGWQEIPASGPNQAGKEVMISSIAKKDLGVYLSIFSRLGIVPIAIEPKSSSIARSFGKTNNLLVLNLEGEILTSVIVKDGFARFAREHKIVGDVHEQFKNFVAEIRRVMNFYLTEQNQEKIESIILDGSGAKRELAEALAKELNLEVKISSDVFQIFKAKVACLPLLGAGIRSLLGPSQDFNLSLLPVGVKEAAEEKQTLLFYGGLANMVVVACILFLALFVGSLIFLDFINKNLTGQIQTLTQASGQKDSDGREIQKNISEINPYLAKEGQIEDKLTYWSGRVDAIQKSIPQGVILNQLNNPASGEALTLVGQADSRETLTTFRDVLAGLDFVSAVQMPSTNFSPNQSVNFTITLSLKK